MLTDYHVHLERGPLTLDWLGLFVDEAERRGILDLGISEHGDRFREMRPVLGHVDWPSDHFADSVHDYLALLGQAPVAFGRRIKAGLEIDYFPEYEGQIAEILSGLSLDYVLGSVHFIGPWGFDMGPDAGWPDRDIDEVYASYFALANQMILSGAFDIMAHPDVIKIFGHKPSMALGGYYEEVADNLARMGMCAEVSTAGLRKPVGEMYPGPAFLAVLRAHNVPITLSSDAHEPGDVGRGYELAIAHARACGYTEIAVFTGRSYELVPLP